jgi:ketosteroid isomerase-like protein
MPSIATILMIVVAPFLDFNYASHNNARDDNDDQSIRQVLDEFGAALKSKDLATLERLWAADYIFINPNGQVVTKAQRLAVLESSESRIDSLNREETNIRTFGNTAVVITRTSAKGQIGGREFDAQFRGTTVLIKTEGRWRIVNQQDNTIPR